MKPSSSAGRPVERRPQESRDGEHPLDVEPLAGGLEHERGAVAAGDRAGLELHSRLAQLLGHRLARLVAEERERAPFGRDDGDADVLVAHVPCLAGGHQRQLVGGYGQTAPGGTTIAMRFE